MSIDIPPMPALTVWQPWASLIACDAKKYETRSWMTKYRGPIAIHAAQLNPLGIRIEADRALKITLAIRSKLGCYDVANLPRGCIIATAELVGCWRIDERVDGGVRVQDSITNKCKCIGTLGDEGLFGDWTPGRYAWELRNVQMLEQPIPAKGHQRLWRWEGVA